VPQLVTLSDLGSDWVLGLELAQESAQGSDQQWVQRSAHESGQQWVQRSAPKLDRQWAWASGADWGLGSAQELSAEGWVKQRLVHSSVWRGRGHTHDMLRCA
jgi:hypothetical protein